MKVSVFGATGKTGVLLVRRLIDAGHTVTVYARNPDKMPLHDHRLEMVQGRLDEPERIEQAIIGCDAVISVLGPVAGSSGRPITAGMRLIVDAMQRHGVRRLVATSTPSVADPQDRFSLPFTLAVALIRTLQRSAYDDIIGAAAVIQASDLDWTLVRLPMLSDAVVDQRPAAGYVGMRGLRLFSLSRTALTIFLEGQLADRSWLRQSPLVSNPRS
ncbi:NAD(P)-dependent oxidoreductase [Sphingomonas phyllosphaerae]|uniref:NAD(P)-dependent oxidoreductase n=1 Tax=Sphingomonas phyllosphaerae TaxID=257003 RepID=UPI0009DC496F|nr:NAD(P)H-binding protein [Sphingomonas phyllosphaerae]